MLKDCQAWKNNCSFFKCSWNETKSIYKSLQQCTDNFGTQHLVGKIPPSVPVFNISPTVCIFIFILYAQFHEKGQQ